MWFMKLYLFQVLKIAVCIESTWDSSPKMKNHVEIEKKKLEMKTLALTFKVIHL